MQPRDSRDDVAPEGVDAADQARILEQDGDAARDDGSFLLALVYYRRAAELRPRDPALEAKIGEAAAGRVRTAERKQPWVGGESGQPNVPAYFAALLTTVALATATALIVDNRHQPNIEEHAVPLTVAATGADAQSNVPAPLPPSVADATASASVDAAAKPHAARTATRVATRKHAKRAIPGRASTFLASGGAVAGGCATQARPCPCNVDSSHHPTQRPMGLLQLIFG